MKKISVVLALALIGSAPNAEGYDQQVSSELSVEGYSVYSVGGTVLMRRRVVESLELGAWNLLPGETDPYHRGPRLAINGTLRLFGDMSVDRGETSPSSEESYVPGLVPLDFDAVTAFVDASGLAGGLIDLRAGRQIRVDTLGFFAFDGGASTMRLPIGLSFDTYIGAEVRGGHILGYDELELDGTDRGGRRDMEQTSYPDRKEASSRLALGAELLLTPMEWLEAAVAYRVVGLSSGKNALADERVGGRLALDFDRVRADAGAVFSPLVNAFSEVDAEVGVTPVDLVTFLAEYHRYEPVFEGDSIFNVFDTAPKNDLGGRMTLRPHRSLDLAWWGYVRVSPGSAGLLGDAEDEPISGAGGGIGGNLGNVVRRLSLRLSYLQDEGESRVGAELGGGHGFFFRERLWLSFRLSYWHIEDDFSKRFEGNTAGYVLSARFRIAHRAHCLVELEHYVGEGRDARLTALALLRMDLWR